MAQTANNLKTGDIIELPVEAAYQSYLGEYIALRAVASNTYCANSKLLWAEKIIAWLPWDAKETNSTITDVKSYGHNHFDVSNILQWLNSQGQPGQWYTPQNDTDAPPTLANVKENPYDAWPGFLTMIDQRLLPYIGDSVYISSNPSATHAQELTSKVFLPSMDELGEANEEPEGALIQEMKDHITTTDTQAAYDKAQTKPTDRAKYWLRTAQRNSDTGVRLVGGSGNIGNNRAFDGQHGIRPLFSLLGNAPISSEKNARGNYEFSFTGPPVNPGPPVSADPIAGRQWKNTWFAAADPDGGPVEYAVEVNKDRKGFISTGSTAETEFNIPIPAAIRPGDIIPVKWSASPGNTEGYAIQRKLNAGEWADLTTTTAEVTQYNDTAPTESTKYTKIKYRIASIVDGERTEYTESKTVWVYNRNGQDVSDGQPLSSLNVGDTIEVPVKEEYQSYLGPTVIWKVADKNHTGYPANSVTAITEKIIALLPADAREPRNRDIQRQSNGNNRHIHTNILQWLNSQGQPGQWYTAKHEFDEPPTAADVFNNQNAYDDWPGFLAMLPEKFVNALEETTLKVVKSLGDGGGSEQFTAKMFIASTTETGLGDINSIAEGAKLALFSNDASKIAYPTTECVSNSEFKSADLAPEKPWHWKLRTPYISGAHGIYDVNITGTALENRAGASNDTGIRPLCNLPGTFTVTKEKNAKGHYELVEI